MKARIPSGYLVIFLETDLSKSGTFDESKLTDFQKSVFAQLSESEREKIRLGYGTLVRDMGGNAPECNFNMDNYIPPESAIKSLARSLLPSIKAYYSDEKNRTAYEKFSSGKGKPKQGE